MTALTSSPPCRPDELSEGVRMGGEYCVIGIPIYEVLEVGVHAKISVSLEVCVCAIDTPVPYVE